MIDRHFETANEARRRKGLPMLTRSQAQAALSNIPVNSSFSVTDFLIGYTTGIPMPSVGGIVGSMLHSSGNSDRPAYSAPEAAPEISSSSSYEPASTSFSDGSSSSAFSDGS